MPRKDTVDAILRAASDIVSHDGVRSLTLDAVAHRAGVSKGGLLYHFQSKDALLAGLVLRQLDEFESEVERRAADMPGGPGRWLRAYVEATFDPSQTIGPELIGALVAAFAENPTLLELVRSRYQRWQQTTNDEAKDSVLASLVRLAADGLFLADLLGLAPAPGTEREALREAMRKLAGGQSGAWGVSTEASDGKRKGHQGEDLWRG